MALLDDIRAKFRSMLPGGDRRNPVQNQLDVPANARRTRLKPEDFENHLQRARRTAERQLEQAYDRARAEHMPNRNPLYSIYINALTDTFVASKVSQRRRAIEQQPFELIDAQTNEPAPEATRKLQNPEVRKLMQYIQEAELWGESTIQVLWKKDGTVSDVFLIPRDHVRPELGIIAEDIWQYQGIQIGDYDNLLHIRGTWEYGTMLHIAKNWIRIKHTRDAWAVFLSTFGVPPFLVGLPDEAFRNEEQVEYTKNMLGSFTEGGASFGMYSNNMEVSQLKGQMESYQHFTAALEQEKSEIREVLLGSLPLSKDGNQDAAKLQKKVTEEIVQRDRQAVMDVMNERVLPLVGLGQYRFQFLRHEQMGMQEEAELLKTLQELDTDSVFDAEQLERRFGVKLS
jgi:hypothetical protein